MGRFLVPFKRPFLPLLLATSALFYLPLGLRALWDAWEGPSAEIAREMLQLNDWVVPNLNYIVHFDTFPLPHWLTALALGLLGPSEFAVRFGSAAFGVLTVAVVYRLGINWKNPQVGFLAGVITAVSLAWLTMTQVATGVMALTFWMTLSLLAGSGLLVERSVHRARRLTYLLAIALAGGVLTQGPAGLFLPLIAVGLVHTTYRRRASLPKLPWKAALIMGSVIALPWFLLMTVRYPSFPYHAVAVHWPTQPLYFIPFLMAGFLPWTVFLPKVVRTWFTHRQAALQRDPEGAVLVTWIAVAFIYFSLGHAKEPWDILPIFPALALLLAQEFDAALQGEVRTEGAAPSHGLMPAWVGGGLAVLILILFLALMTLKLPHGVLSLEHPAWKVFLEHSHLLALMLGLGIFILVGVWGMRQTRAAIAGVIGVQVLIFISAVLLAPEFNPYFSTQAVSERFLQRARAEDSIVAYGIPSSDVQALAFYLQRRIPAAEDESPQAMLALPVGTWGVTDPAHWQALRQGVPGETFQLATQGPRFLLFRKDR
jgi:4-amino-4-deoxy-L-arabinose transferase-like glycosyltransferase